MPNNEQKATSSGQPPARPHTTPGSGSVRRSPVSPPLTPLRGRIEVMERLHSFIRPGVMVVLHGRGGSGKTALAHALFQQATSESDRIGLWVNATDATSLQAGMLAVAADRGAGNDELAAARTGPRAADLVWRCLDRSPEPWLLVLDNADAPSVLRNEGWLRTSSRGTVLITTRRAAARWWPDAELLRLDILSKADAAQVLRDFAPEVGTLEEAEALADRVGRLPLALTLVGGFLAHQAITPWTMTEYGAHVPGGQDAGPMDLPDQGVLAAGGADFAYLASSTWRFSLSALERRGIPESVTLLRLLACWSEAPLPLSLLSELDMGDALPRDRVEPALRGLLDQSLTEVVPGSVRCLRTRKGLLDSVRQRTPTGQRDPLAAAAARQLLAALPQTPQRGEPNPHTSLLIPHALALLSQGTDGPAAGHASVEAAEAGRRLVVSLHRGGDYAAALAVAESAIELGTRQLGSEHPALLRLRERLARSLYRLGRFRESETAYREVLADCERVLGADAPETLTCREGLARLLVAAYGPSTTAARLVRRVVAARTRALGRTHALSLLARTYLMEVYEGRDLIEELPAGRALIEECHHELGPNHPITLIAQQNYAYALASSGMEAQALPTVRETVAAMTEAFGSAHPTTLTAQTLLARTLAALGEHTEAVEHAEAVVRGRTRVLGPEHAWTTAAQRRLDQFRAMAT